MADIIKFPSSAKKIGDIAGDDFLLDLLHRAAMNPDSEITMDDYKKYKKTGSFAEGGMANINDMTGSISSPKRGYVDGPGSYAGEIDDFPFGRPGDPGFRGTDPTVDPLKDTRRQASARTTSIKPWNTYLKDAGYVKNAGVDDVKDYAKKGIKIKVGQVIGSNAAFRNTLRVLGVEPKTKQAINVLNQALQRAKKPMYVVGTIAGKDVVEDLISAVTDTEFAHPNTKVVRDATSDKIKQLKTQGNKLHGANPSKAKNAFFKTALERMYPVLKTTAKGAAILTSVLAKKALGYIPITTEMGSGELPKNPMKDEILENIDFSGPSADSQLLEQLSQDAVMNKRGGGMTDIYDMTKPLGYAGGGFEDRMSMLKESMMDTEAKRRADMETGDPEMGRTSTFGTVTEDNVRDVALKIARQQGDTSEESINLIIRQLMALTPSLEQTVGEETGYAAPKGLRSLMDKAKVMLGQKSDPMLRRDVGFERVR